MIKDWQKQASQCFAEHINAYKSLNEKQQQKFERKKAHILRVTDNAMELCSRLNTKDSDTKIAYAVALFHDLGRFEQYVKSDKECKEHGAVAVELLELKNILDELRFYDDEKSIIYKAIENHGKLKIEGKLNERELFHAQLIRDADKLDIFQVVTEHYSHQNPKELSWNLPRGGAVSEKVKKAALNGNLVDKNDIQNEIDAKILQLSWLYDINFKSTYEITLNKRYIETIYNSLPKSDAVIEIHRKVKVYAENQIYAKKNR